MPAARKFIREQKLNEVIPGDLDDIGIIVMGGLTNSVLRALERVGLCRRVRHLARAAAGAQRRLSAGAGGDPRVLRDKTRRARRRGRLARLHRAGGQRRTAPRRHTDESAGQGTAAGSRRIFLRRAARGPGRLPASRQAQGRSMPRPSRKRRAACSRTRRKPRPRSDRCRRARRPSAPAARSGRCSPPSS